MEVPGAHSRNSACAEVTLITLGREILPTSSTPDGCLLHLAEDIAKVGISPDSWVESNSWFRRSLVWKEKGSLGRSLRIELLK